MLYGPIMVIHYAAIHLHIKQVQATILTNYQAINVLKMHTELYFRFYTHRKLN